jgi:hypothetical protein
VIPHVDIVVLSRSEGPLHPEVDRGIKRQRGVKITVHRVIGQTLPGDSCRWDAIARGRNKGMAQGNAPWLMFLDDDVVLEPVCVATLVRELSRRPVYGALAADYLGQAEPGVMARHVSMGATLFRREALRQINFKWREGTCECQCCCDDLRRLLWGIDYCEAAKARHIRRRPVGNCGAERSDSDGKAASGQILAAFNRRDLKPFIDQFLRSLRRSGNKETVIPLALSLYPSEQSRLAQMSNVKPVFRMDDGRFVARQRLRGFQYILKRMSPKAPVAYWDAGDVIFQASLRPLWELVRQHPNKLLVAQEPVRHPESPTITNWTRGIDDPAMRRKVRALLYPRPWLNAGFVAGNAGALLQYFGTVADWYDKPLLAGANNKGDQLALNVYCHTNPDVWQEIPESWNYCLCRRNPKLVYRREDGRYVDVRGVPIYAIHGNGGTLPSVRIRRARRTVSTI